MRNILTVIGTRPEAIKLIPLIQELTQSKLLQNKICVTKQHTSLLKSFNIEADYQFTPCEPNASLAKMAAHMLLQFNNLLKQVKPYLIIVQGDTTTAFIAALAGFYSKIKIAHIEAGLRSNDLSAPWPEEAHRQIIDKISDYFFTPTEKAKNNLINEQISADKIWVVGNTSIDAIRIIKDQINFDNSQVDNTIIVTIHRRENHGQPFINICEALKLIAREFPLIKIKFCLHPNPAVHSLAKKILSQIKNIKLLPALEHTEFVKLLSQATFIVTDSGGVQEEATFLGKPVLITRNNTERIELIDAMTGILVGSNTQDIAKYIRQLLQDHSLLAAMSRKHFPYGDGYASRRIVRILEQIVNNE